MGAQTRRPFKPSLLLCAGAYTNLVKLQMQQAEVEEQTQVEVQEVMEAGGKPVTSSSIDRVLARCVWPDVHIWRRRVHGVIGGTLAIERSWALAAQHVDIGELCWPCIHILASASLAPASGGMCRACSAPVFPCWPQTQRNALSGWAGSVLRSSDTHGPHLFCKLCASVKHWRLVAYSWCVCPACRRGSKEVAGRDTIGSEGGGACLRPSLSLGHSSSTKTVDDLLAAETQQLASRWVSAR